MSNIPHYFLYGEELPESSPDYMHIARLEQSLPKHNWEIHPHRHDDLHQLMILESGSMTAQIRESSAEYQGGCVLSIPAREVHGFVHQPGVTGFILSISQPFILSLFNESERQALSSLLREPLVIPLTEGRHIVELKALGERLLAEYQGRESGQASMIGAYLKIVFISLSRQIQHREPTQPSDAKTALFEKFTALVEQHYHQHWSVNEYATALGLSQGQLNRTCQRSADQQALEIIHGRIVDEAKRLLIFTQLSSKEIGYQLGFKDPGYFSRFFTRHVGQAPKQFQQQLLKEQVQPPK
ncbi:helix-turn-helix domain-containing protein [Enterovibrio norvegicus]|uniref:AraC family transcriptional regulator, transcriptional activator of pobA n=1 Tax=Enterovibrio norvegicus DSM 15893 TaxID=1121869 RepID=A0A1I5X6M9_9GAMM|nr:helix-turn-helix domain-containing protein [Enterovibrio norvegicus]SFQ27297.1 AraC family transcriptional regulator, transcriptional activator of pobA [Enterovibrio norvegicus DSM 15893]